MVTRRVQYRGCSIFANAVAVGETGHFITTLAIEMGSMGTFNAPIACRPFQNAADALESNLTTARVIVDTIVRSFPQSIGARRLASAICAATAAR